MRGCVSALITPDLSLIALRPLGPFGPLCPERPRGRHRRTQSRFLLRLPDLRVPRYPRLLRHSLLSPSKWRTNCCSSNSCCLCSASQPTRTSVPPSPPSSFPLQNLVCHRPRQSRAAPPFDTQITQILRLNPDACDNWWTVEPFAALATILPVRSTVRGPTKCCRTGATARHRLDRPGSRWWLVRGLWGYAAALVKRVNRIPLCYSAKLL